MSPTVALFGTLDTKGPGVRVPSRAGSRPRRRRAARRRRRPRRALGHARRDARGGGRGRRASTSRRSRRKVTAAPPSRRWRTAPRRLARRLHADGRIDAIAGLGGSGGSAIVTEAMRALPIGVPKLMVSTLASGDTRPYVGAVDVTMMYSVVDIAGLNQVSRRILANAAGAIAGMAAVEPEPADDAGRSWERRCSGSRRRASPARGNGSRSSATRSSSSTPRERAAARWRR